jgi:hypothetical protein
MRQRCRPQALRRDSSGAVASLSGGPNRTSATLDLSGANSSVVERLVYTEDVVGSNPASPSSRGSHLAGRRVQR